jgi:Flp pilus assembly protein TadG
MTRFAATQPRRGAITPLTALSLVFVVAMLAFAVDVGWIVTVKSELQNAADAAALAGAAPLMDGYVQYNLPGQAYRNAVLSTAKANARAEAKKFAAMNKGGNVPLALADSDIEFGYTDNSAPPNYYAEGDPKYPAGAFPNTVKVTLRRDQTNSAGSLPLFFGPVLGVPTADVAATAAATAYAAGNIDNFKGVPGLTLRVLPMTYDVNNWNSFLAGTNPDATTDAASNPALQVYPSTKQTGNFGELSLDGAHSASSLINGWIDNGLSASDVSSLQGLKLIPLSQHDNTQWDWVGNPGLKDSTIQTAQGKAGTNFILPLFDPYQTSPYSAGNGQGSNYYYQIVRFVGIKVLSAPGKGIVVQPAAFRIDPSLATFTTPPVPAGTPGTSQATIFVGPKLTQ